MEGMSEQGSFLWLRVLCEVLFQVMLKNENVLLVITRMEEEHQIELK